MRLTVMLGEESSLTSNDCRVFKRKREETFLDLVLCWLDSNSLHLQHEQGQSRIAHNES